MAKKGAFDGAKRTRRFAAGQLTIIDPSDPFIDPAFARGLFEIVTRIFIRSDVGTGKVLLVDEAHKVCRSPPSQNIFSFDVSLSIFPTTMGLVDSRSH